MKPHDALREYIENSELRIVVDNVFHVRMSSDIARDFDAGKYNTVIKDVRDCIDELINMNIVYPSNARPVFYMYIVPDDNFVELLRFPNKNAKSGGCPVNAYDMDSFNTAYGSCQKTIGYDGMIKTEYHVLNIHELAHIIKDQFGIGTRMFDEGFAEMVPWYALEYEKLVPGHLDAIKSLDKIYTANELLASDFFNFYNEKYKTVSYAPAYISSYLWVRAVVEHIRIKYDLSRFGAVQKFLELNRFIKFGTHWFVFELAKIIDMDAEKLLNSVDYQIEMIKQIEKEVKG